MSKPSKTTAAPSSIPPMSALRAKGAARTSLTRQTLLKMAVRVALVIALATVASYLHGMDTMTGQALDGLRNYVTARGEREQWIFDLARDNQEAVAARFVQRLHDAAPADPFPQIERRFVRFPDGVLRSRPELHDPGNAAAVAILEPSKLDADAARRVLVAQDTLAQMGYAMHIRLQNTWMVLPENVMVGYWPEEPGLAHQYKPQDDLPGGRLFQAASPENNPERRSVWSDIYWDRTGRGVVSLVTPIYDKDRFLGVVGHDVTLSELLERTAHLKLAGTYNVIVRPDGNLITHPRLDSAIEKAGGGFHVSRAGDPELLGIYEAARSIEGEPGVVEDPSGALYLGVIRLRGPGWYLVVVYPKAVLQMEAYEAARFVLVAGVASLLLEIGILFWILRSQVARPIGELLAATRRVASGMMDIDLDTRRRDELGELASSFNAMTEAVRSREERSRRAEEELAAMLQSEREKNDALARLRAEVDVLGTPVLSVWKDVLVLPLIGAVDDRRASSMAEKLLHEVARTRCRNVIIDITGIEGIDAPTAARLLGVVAAVRLLGAHCLLTGIGADVARALVELDVDLGSLVTLRTLEDGLRRYVRRAPASRGGARRATGRALIGGV
jgi:anti-anti-sigma regulatory factor/HAMP domain-containing protein